MSSTPPSMGPTTRSRSAHPPAHPQGEAEFSRPTTNTLALHVPLPQSPSASSAQPPFGVGSIPLHHNDPSKVSPPDASPSGTPRITQGMLSQDLINLRILETLERLSGSTPHLPSIPATTPAPREPEATTRERAKLAREPDPFSGDRTKLEGFIATTQLYFDAYPSSFPSDKTKITFILTNLRGPILSSFQPYITQQPQPLILTDYASFLTHIRRTWGAADEKGTARRSLRRLRQTSSANSFFIEFQRLTAILGWSGDNEILVDKAIEKLSDNLQDELARAQFEPTNLNELIDWATALDNRLRARSADRSTFKPELSKVHQPKSASSTPPAVSSSPSRPREPLTEEEKARRLTQGLCKYCANSGHTLATCGLLQARNERQAKAQGRSA